MEQVPPQEPRIDNRVSAVTSLAPGFQTSASVFSDFFRTVGQLFESKDTPIGKETSQRITQQAIDGDVQRSNLFLQDDFVAQSYIDTDGTAQASPRMIRTRPYELEEVTRLYVNRKLKNGGAFYNSRGEKIGMVEPHTVLNSEGMYTIQVPMEAKYVIFNVRKEWRKAFVANTLNENVDPRLAVRPASIEAMDPRPTRIKFAGDSLTAHEGLDQAGTFLKGYQEYFTDKGALERTVAYPGATIRRYNPRLSRTWHESAYHYIVEERTQVKNVDRFVFFLGTNDSGQGLHLGDKESTNPNTTIGAFRACMNYLTKTNPDMPITVITPIYSERAGHSVTNLRKITEAMIEVSQDYPQIEIINGLEAFDLNASNIHEWTYDLLHLNNEGYRQFSQLLLQRIPVNETNYGKVSQNMTKEK